MSETKKVYELANELSIPSLELLKQLREGLKVEVKSHMSDLAPEIVGQVIEFFRKQKELADASVKKPKAVVRRTSAPAAAAPVVTATPAVTTKTVVTAETAPQPAASKTQPVKNVIRRTRKDTEELALKAAQQAALALENSVRMREETDVSEEVVEAGVEGQPPVEAARTGQSNDSKFKAATILSRPDKPFSPPVRNDRRPPVGGARPGGGRFSSGPATVPDIPTEDASTGRRHPKDGRVAETTEELAVKRGVPQLRGTETFDASEYFKKTKESIAVKRRRSALGRPARKTLITTPKDSKRVVEFRGPISFTDMAAQMSVKAHVLLKKAGELGADFESTDQLVDLDTAQLLAQEFQFEVRDISFKEEEMMEKVRGVDSTTRLEGTVRPPVVTIMGHVDHGKTSLLDKIRKANVVATESGGITQHIGAYEVNWKGKKIAFLDTPGHEAFTKIRSRGASATDIVILVVSAAEGVKAQTLEAISHAKAAEVPVIVAANKIDLPDAQPDRVKQELSQHGILTEDWGGDVIFCPVSAHTGAGIDSLLESILLQAEVLDLKANPEVPAKGIIIESRLDKNAGALATVLVQDGTLHTGSLVVAGITMGKIRRMQNDQGKDVKEAGPSTPVEILGLNGVPEAGDQLLVVSDERAGKELVEQRLLHDKKRAQEQSSVTLEQLYARMQEGKVLELPLILKADVKGSLEACQDSLAKLPQDKVRLKVIYAACGGVTENDVQLAVASKAIVFGFNVRPETKAMRSAEHEKVTIKTYKIIYEMIDEVKNAMKGLLGTTRVEKVLGRAEVRDTFNVPKIGTIAGTAVVDGKILRSAFARLLRDSRIVFEGKIGSLKRFKEDVREVATGYECGIGLENFNDIKQGDIIETYTVEEVAADAGGL